jgi:3-dehydroquinate dehydratase-2
MTIRLAALFGANLNMLGRRNPEHYGVMTLADVERHLRDRAELLGCELEVFQSNTEGELIGWVQAHRDELHGYMVNPGGFTMFGQGLRDALLDTEAPVIEVHWSNIHRRGIKSIWSEDAVGQICGFHWRGALAALEVLDGLARDAAGVAGD